MHCPFGAGAAMCGKLHTGSSQPFGNIAGIIDPHEKERYAPHMRCVQSGQPVANLL